MRWGAPRPREGGGRGGSRSLVEGEPVHLRTGLGTIPVFVARPKRLSESEVKKIFIYLSQPYNCVSFQGGIHK